eukprot:scaffold14916_cov128-Isochrysis_galbana.AAC.17
MPDFWPKELPIVAISPASGFTVGAAPPHSADSGGDFLRAGGPSGTARPTVPYHDVRPVDIFPIKFYRFCGCVGAAAGGPLPK